MIGDETPEKARERLERMLKEKKALSFHLEGQVTVRVAPNRELELTSACGLKGTDVAVPIRLLLAAETAQSLLRQVRGLEKTMDVPAAPEPGPSVQ